MRTRLDPILRSPMPHVRCLFLTFSEIHRTLSINPVMDGTASETGMEGGGSGVGAGGGSTPKTRFCGARGSPDAGVGSMTRSRAGCRTHPAGYLRHSKCYFFKTENRPGGGPQKKILFGIARNLLKSLESDEGIQGRPRKCKPVFLGMAWNGLVWLGPARALLREKEKAPRFVLGDLRRVLPKRSGQESVKSRLPEASRQFMWRSFGRA